MQEYDITALRGLLEKVRGETRIKTKEEGIRNQFLQSAVEEIFVEHDWDMNKRTETLEIDGDGFYPAPTDFSMFNDFWFEGADGVRYDKKKDQINVTMDGKTILLSGPTDTSLLLHYYIVAPNLLQTTPKVLSVRFPQPMLIAERAYVRLKTAYFPDETSEKEEARSFRMIRSLALRGQPRPRFTHKAFGN